MKLKCMYKQKMHTKGYYRCARDNSIRKASCKCPHYITKVDALKRLLTKEQLK